MFVSITCQLLQENNLLCSQRNTQRKLVLIKLILKINIQWWIHLSLKCISHHMETVFKLLTLHVKVHVLIMSFPLYLPVENNCLCSQSSRMTKLETIKLRSNGNIQWWIHLSPRYFIHHMETMVKILTLQVKVSTLVMPIPLQLIQENNFCISKVAC